MPTISEAKEDSGGGASFTLRNAGTGFEGRSSDIFGQLDVLEREHISHEESRTDLEEYADLSRDDSTADSSSRPSDQDPDHSSRTEKKCERPADRRQHSRQEPQFRRPAGKAPGRNRGRIPDHGNKPQSWTYYCLEDVKRSDMSEKSNTQAALAFLDERRKLKAEQDREAGLQEEEAFDVGSAACSKGLFSFAKRSKTDKSSTGHSTLDKHQLPTTDSAGKIARDKSGTSSVEFARDKSGTSSVELTTLDADTEGILEGETAESSSSSKEETVQAGFKSRKGIRRNIRTRDDDD